MPCDVEVVFACGGRPGRLATAPAASLQSVALWGSLWLAGCGEPVASQVPAMGNAGDAGGPNAVAEATVDDAAAMDTDPSAAATDSAAEASVDLDAQADVDAPVSDGPSLTTAPYTNPVIDSDFPDPAVLHAGDGFYYAYATQGPWGNIQVARSKDLVHWTRVGDALNPKPAWANQTQNFWAPHVTQVGATYFLYFASDQNGHGSDKCLGVATSSTPSGPFQATAQPLLCGASFDCIDPMELDDKSSGKPYLYWGSAGQPLRVEELAADHLSFAAGAAPSVVLSTSNKPYEGLIEGAWVTERAGYYYLFYSGNDCCTLPNPSYAVMVARGASPTGPFTKRADALNTPDSTIVVHNARWKAPGHNAVIRDESGADWLVYHAADANMLSLSGGGIRRPMLIDRMDYVNGWPEVAGATPSTTEQVGPAVRQ